MQEIYVTGSDKKAIIDDEDYSNVAGYCWSISNNRSICANINGKTRNLAAWILNSSENYVDHKDGDVFNNLKANLRKATASQNGANRKISKSNCTGFKGVHFDSVRSKFVAAIKINGTRIFLGRFNNSEEAAIAYNNAAIKHFGEFARINQL